MIISIMKPFDKKIVFKIFKGDNDVFKNCLIKLQFLLVFSINNQRYSSILLILYLLNTVKVLEHYFLLSAIAVSTNRI